MKDTYAYWGLSCVPNLAWCMRGTREVEDEGGKVARSNQRLSHLFGF